MRSFRAEPLLLNTSNLTQNRSSNVLQYTNEQMSEESIPPELAESLVGEKERKVGAMSRGWPAEIYS